MSKEKKNRGLVESATGVYRIPATVKAAVEAEATAAGVSPAAVVREALARDLKRRGYELAPETAQACGL